MDWNKSTELGSLQLAVISPGSGVIGGLIYMATSANR